jgi:ABC-type polysaccharide/polyol phosphate export permease
MAAPLADPLPSVVVLEGTSSKESIPGLPDDVPAPRERNGQIIDRPRSDEPRPEIWFHRRVSLVGSLRELWAFRELVITLAERDLRIRYKQAVLGVAWALISPLAMMIAFTLIFSKITKTNTFGSPYALFSYLGLLPWTFFSAAVSTGGLSLTANVPLLNKLYCPREVFPLASIADAIADLIIATLVLLLLFPLLGFAPKSTSFYVPLLLVVMLVFTFGVTVAVSAIVVFMRDLRLVLPLVIQLGLFVTPVVYGIGSITKSQPAQAIYSFINPLAPVIDGLRRAVLFGQAPNWTDLAAGSVSSVLILIGGFLLFKRLETGMADVA